MEVMRKWLGIILLVVAVAIMAAQNIGDSPKQSLDPKTYNQISGKDSELIARHMMEQHSRLLVDTDSIKTDIAVLKNSILDINHRLDIQRSGIDSMKPEINLARLTAVELFVKRHEDERAQELVNHQALMSWLRGIGGGVLTAIFGICVNFWLAFKREGFRKSDAKTMINQEEGMTDKISSLSEAKGHSDEKQGIKQVMQKEKGE
jgi:hypothetical protein